MNYRVLNEKAAQGIKDVIDDLSGPSKLEEETIELLLIKFDEYLNWIDGNYEHGPELNRKSLITVFYAFFYGFCCGEKHLHQAMETADIAEETINNLIRR